jgi:hypothetical protein
MSYASRLLKVGDRVTTDYDEDYGGITECVITAIKVNTRSQSGICFQVDPPPRGCGKDSWLDADWFEPIKDTAK